MRPTDNPNNPGSDPMAPQPSSPSTVSPRRSRPGRGKRACLAVGLALTVLTGAAGGYSWWVHHDSDDLWSSSVAGLDRLPSYDVQDWATFVDYYALVTVTAETPQEPEYDEGDPSKGGIGRNLTVHIDKILWSRPSPTRPALPESVTWPDFGWSFDGDKKTPIIARGTLRQTVGHTYAVPIVLYSDGWGPLNEVGMPEYKNGRIYGPEKIGDAAAMWANPGPDGKPISWVLARLNKARPWPVCGTKNHPDAASYTGVERRSKAVVWRQQRPCPPPNAHTPGAQNGKKNGHHKNDHASTQDGRQGQADQ